MHLTSFLFCFVSGYNQYCWGCSWNCGCSTHWLSSWLNSFMERKLLLMLVVFSMYAVYHYVNLIYISSLACRFHYLHHQSSSMWLVPWYGWCSPAVSLKVFLSITDSCSSHSLCMRSGFLTQGGVSFDIYKSDNLSTKKWLYRYMYVCILIFQL